MENDAISPADPDRENGLPRVVDVESSAEVRDAFHNNVRVRWEVTVKCKCKSLIELSSLTAIVQCEDCGAEWDASSALSR